MIECSKILVIKWNDDYEKDGLVNNSWHTLYMNAPMNNIYECVELYYERIG